MSGFKLFGGLVDRYGNKVALEKGCLFTFDLDNGALRISLGSIGNVYIKKSRKVWKISTGFDSRASSLGQCRYMCERMIGLIEAMIGCRMKQAPLEGPRYMVFEIV